MRGYCVLAMITVLLLALAPPFLFEREGMPAAQSAATHTTVRVNGENGEDVSVDIQDFLRWSVVSCLPPEAPAEAIKAVAVAQQSLLQYCFLNNEEAVAYSALEGDMCAESYWIEAWGEEVYRSNIDRFDAAIKEVSSVSMSFQGKPVKALMHSMNNGQTESAETVFGQKVPYLLSVESPPDALEPDRLTTVMVSEKQAGDILRSLAVLPPSSATEWFGDTETSGNGTVLKVKIGDRVLSGTDIQQAFSLPSAMFRVSAQEGQLIFTVQGRGHFVGMSLYGCVAMAKEGLSFRDILKRYYSGVDIT